MPGHYLLNWRSCQGSNRRAGLAIQITSVFRRRHIIASIESYSIRRAYLGHTSCQAYLHAGGMYDMSPNGAAVTFSAVEELEQAVRSSGSIRDRFCRVGRDGKRNDLKVKPQWPGVSRFPRSLLYWPRSRGTSNRPVHLPIWCPERCRWRGRPRPPRTRGSIRHRHISSSLFLLQ